MVTDGTGQRYADSHESSIVMRSRENMTSYFRKKTFLKLHNWVSINNQQTRWSVLNHPRNTQRCIQKLLLSYRRKIERSAPTPQVKVRVNDAIGGTACASCLVQIQLPNRLLSRLVRWRRDC